VCIIAFGVKSEVNNMWQVILEQRPRINDFPVGFFPRKVYYKRDAEILKKEVEEKGGAAHIEKAGPLKRTKCERG